ncbi:ABC transporter permease [Polluticaenibacter yanchengensis]|uniref:ABC transporter permease n=1 Tax=Polluticaenibacter yanchengensis TaxID=3014562 RepID=A0ABT4ULT6_9BACT|nr:ABC transporter permease [Chitinophagaceae bacterium LY-5]
MVKTLKVLWTSLKMALDELRVNKLRTFLSLFGVTIGIFCIIGVFAVVQSLQSNIEIGLKGLGTNTIYIQKWPWGGGGDYPWWKYMKRPEPRYREMEAIKARSQYLDDAAFMLFYSSNVEYKENILENVIIYGATDGFEKIQEVVIAEGRGISAFEYTNGAPVVVIGYENAVKLFESPERAVGKTVSILNKKVQIIGVIKKKGTDMIGGWDFDNICICPYNYSKSYVSEENADKLLLVKGKEGIPIETFKYELKGIMRSLRKIPPTKEDDFALNEVTSSSKEVEQAFSGIKAGGLVIGGFSLIVGLFGIANIMFVTVKERTSQIGLKKAIGAKRSFILLEFLLESSFLCIIGGLIGLGLVFLTFTALSAVVPFDLFIETNIIVMAIVISIFVGLLAGFIPAWRASKLDPVVAIRSK